MTGELAIRESSQADTKSAFEYVMGERLALVDAGPEDTRDIRNRAELAEAYAKAHQLRDAYYAAAAVRLWAERRIGELRARIPRGNSHSVDSPRKDFDSSIGDGKRAFGWSCEKLARIPEDAFIEMLEESRRQDLSFALYSFLRRAGMNDVQRVDRGIYKSAVNSNLVLIWRKDGVSRRKSLNHQDLDKARHELARVSGKLAATHKRYMTKQPRVPDVQAEVQRICQMLDRVSRVGMVPEAKKELDRAYSELGKAEQALVRAALLT